VGSIVIGIHIFEVIFFQKCFIFGNHTCHWKIPQLIYPNCVVFDQRQTYCFLLVWLIKRVSERLTLRVWWLLWRSYMILSCHINQWNLLFFLHGILGGEIVASFFQSTMRWIPQQFRLLSWEHAPSEFNWPVAPSCELSSQPTDLAILEWKTAVKPRNEFFWGLLGLIFKNGDMMGSELSNLMVEFCSLKMNRYNEPNWLLYVLSPASLAMVKVLPLSSGVWFLSARRMWRKQTDWIRSFRVPMLQDAAGSWAIASPLLPKLREDVKKGCRGYGIPSGKLT
jgi:hypothetical protein